MENETDSPGRGDSPRAFRKLLVVACPRSGTRYTTRVLRRSGLVVAHENNGADGSVSCFFAVDDYEYHGRHTDGRRSSFDFGSVLHQVRDPLSCIGSMAGWFTGGLGWFWHWQEKHTGLSPDDHSPVELAARFWLDWNRRCEAQADWTYRIEDLPRVWPRVCAAAGIEGKEFPEGVARMNASDGKAIPVSWDSLKSLDEGLAEEIRRTAERYGYEVSN